MKEFGAVPFYTVACSDDDDDDGLGEDRGVFVAAPIKNNPSTLYVLVAGGGE